jgi:hypothetical protein
MKSYSEKSILDEKKSGSSSIFHIAICVSKDTFFSKTNPINAILQNSMKK